MLNINDYTGAKDFFRFFEEISRIPHGSGNTSKIADYLVDFAKERGLRFYRDPADNVIISKNATLGMENRPGIIFQGHTDMVAEKTQDCDKDMTSEGLDLFRDGDFLRARGTTLGGDDGVAVAYALAILNSEDIPHPDFDAIFTSDEEIGLIGAKALESDRLSEILRGKMLINIDSDAEGIFTVGCAGGLRSDIKLHVSSSPYKGKGLIVTLRGLKGGHSGVEIDKGRENAVKLLAKALSSISIPGLSEFSGGNADNAIPREATCKLQYREGIDDELKEALSRVADEYKSIEPDIDFTVSTCDIDGFLVSEHDSNALISLICKLPSGVIRMMEDIENLVETSLNLGILRLSASCAELSFSIRSAKASEKRALADTVTEIATEFGATVSEHGDYPAWEYRKESPLRDTMCRVYRNMYGKDAEVVTIHAGLECGILSDKIPGLDCVSIGPDNYDIHTTEERLSIPSAIRVWEFLLEVMKEI